MSRSDDARLRRFNLLPCKCQYAQQYPDNHVLREGKFFITSIIEILLTTSRNKQNNNLNKNAFFQSVINTIHGRQ
jgi:hypothetical protein